jgi:hypothetical protein
MMSNFPISRMGSKRLVWIPDTIKNRLTVAQDVLKCHTSKRSFKVNTIKKCLETFDRPPRKSKKKKELIKELAEKLKPRMLAMIKAGWEVVTVVRRALESPQADEAGMESKISTHRQYARGFLAKPIKTAGETTVEQDLQRFLSCMTDGQQALQDKLLSYTTGIRRFKTSKLILRHVIFRSHSGIGDGVIKTAVELDSLWQNSADVISLYDLRYPTGVRVLNNTRDVGMYNAPIPKKL